MCLSYAAGFVMENAFQSFVKGLQHLKAHPVLFVPGCIHNLAAYVLSLFFTTLSVLILYYDMGYIILSAVSLFFIILLAFFSAFTTAGAIGMSKEVMTSGCTDLYHMLSYGKKYTLKLVIVSVLVTLLRSFSAIFWKPALELFVGSEYTTSDIASTLQSDPLSLLPLLQMLAIPSLIALLLTIIYFLLLSFLFYLISYIIVVDDLSVYKSYRQSFSYLTRRPVRIITFVLMAQVVGFIPNILAGLLILGLPMSRYLPFFIVLANMVFSILFMSVMSVWVTRFYMILEKKDISANI